MGEKQVQSIVFKGIERLNERINTNNGACEEIINLRPKGNTWENIRERQLQTSLIALSDEIQSNSHPLIKGKYEIIIHPASEQKYIIVWDKERYVNSGVVYLYNKKGNMQRVLFPYNNIYNENIISVTYLDNILTICTKKDKYFFLWKDSEYIPLNLSNIRPLIKTQGINVPNDNRGYSYHKLNDGSTKIATLKTGTEGGNYNFTKSIKSVENYYPENVCAIIKECLQQDENLKWNNTTPSNRIKGLSLYRVAIELTDGSYSLYSNIDFADTVRKDDNDNYVYGDAVRFKFRPSNSSSKYTFDVTPYEVVIPNVFGYHRITIKFNDIQEIKTLIEQGVIKSVSVFMTPPISAYDVDNYDDYKTFWGWDWQPKKINRTHLCGNKEDTADTNSIFASSIYKFPVFLPINKEILSVFESGAFYRVKKISLTEINDYINNGAWETNEINIDIYANDIKNLTANPLLPTPNVSENNKVVFANSYVYNAKQHLFDLRYSMFGGYALNDTYNYLTIPFLNIDTELYYCFKGKYENKDFEIRQKFPSEYCNIDNNNNSVEVNIPPALNFQYSMIDIESFEVYTLFSENGTQYKITLYKKSDLIEHTGQNTSFNIIVNPKKNTSDITYDNTWEENKDYSIFDIDYGTDNLLKENKQNNLITLSDKTIYSENNINEIRLTNTLQLTGTNNALTQPNAENYSFGEIDNQIIAIRSSTGSQNLNDRNFGTAPLYVFCTDGVYAMTVGNGEIAYSSIVKLNDESIINPNTISTPLGIVFLTKSGLYIIGRNGMINIGEVMRGHPTMTTKNNYYQVKKYIAGIGVNELKNITPTIYEYVKGNGFEVADIQKEFFEEIKNAQMYYDVVHREIVLSNIPNIKGSITESINKKNIYLQYDIKITYSYVYNIDYKIWYKRVDNYQVNNDTILSERVYSKGNFYINIYSIDEVNNNDNDICKNITIITKPILLDTRQYKHIERSIFNIKWNNKNDFYIVIMGSNDGVNYSIIKSIHQKTDNSNNLIEKQDYYLSRTLKSAKYISIWLLGSNLYDTKISNVLFMDTQRKNVAGIR